MIDLTPEERAYYETELRQFRNLVRMHKEIFWSNYLEHAAQMIERLLPPAPTGKTIPNPPATVRSHRVRERLKTDRFIDC